MLWLARPPYLRWIAAVTLVLGALAWEASERATEPIPFADVDIARGQIISADDIEWRHLPAGSLSVPTLGGVTASTAIKAGDPITTSVISDTPSIPLDTWAIPIRLPVGLASGAGVRLVFQDGSAASGIVIQSSIEDSLGMVIDGLVAVPAPDADAAALAASNGELVVLFEP